VVGYREEHSMQALVKEFRTFLLRGNLVDMAVGIVIGIAFAALVNALVTDLITPIIAAIAGKHDFSSLSFTINKSRFLYGDFINAILAFVSIAAAVFFFVVRPVNTLLARRQGGDPGEETVRPCPECLSEIPKAAHRCAFCTAQVAPA
jgi:large conductance mechanosensitive channel